MTSRQALITGATGQDGRYLAELLLSKGYSVAGLVHAADTSPPLDPAVVRIEGDITDITGLVATLTDLKPDEIYNLAAQSSVGASFADPVNTIDVNGMGTVRLLEACRGARPEARVFQASSSEIFGDASGPLDEASAINPTSPYGVAKALGHQAAATYRRAYSMYVCCGILFNHESPRRDLRFVTRKITDAAARVSLGMAESVALGNLDVWRDWGFASDYVNAMYLTLQQAEPDDYVIASGECHSLQEFLQLAFEHVGLDWHQHVVVDQDLVRPSEIARMHGDPSKARRQLGWQTTVDFPGLVAMMVDTDLARLQTAVPADG